MTAIIRFWFWSSVKDWRVVGKDMDEIIKKADAMCEKYHAIHFEVMEVV